MSRSWQCFSALSNGDMQNIQVLVIEDSKVHVELIRGMLRQPSGVSFAVEVFHRLASGLAHLDSADVDVILLDLTLPDSDGLASFRRVADRAPNLPIVVLTGTDDEGIAIKALQAGAQDYLFKGKIDSQLLARSLRYAIERKRGELELQRAHDELELRVEERTAELRQMQDAARRQHEELAHASRINTLGEMASGLAHEVNQPLMAIIGFMDGCLQLLDSDRFDKEQFREIISDTASEATRAGEIIKRLRKLVSKRSTQIGFIDLSELVNDTIPLLGRNLDIAIHLELAERLPKVAADRIQIQQVILNLTHNAVQAMDSMDCHERILTLRTSLVDNNVCVEVRDSGLGLSGDDDIHQLFQPFFSRKPSGLGLGLSISRSIIETHVGKLTAHANSDRGLTFHFSLPVSKNQGHDESAAT